ncbi:MAG: glycosyltransferase [Candidatus Synoicihabitans palmerolidicus]|nr:glycosyltransferase [Candidatus Synoicihabitans palmerolidicus]
MLIGGRYDREQRLADKLGISESVLITGHVSDAERNRLMNESIAFVYPSRYEGWGLGIGEALIAGTPVIAGIGGAQAEVGGNAMLTIAPDSPADIARARSQVLDPKTRARLLTGSKNEVPRLLDLGIAKRVMSHMTALDHHRSSEIRRNCVVI